MAPRWTKKQTRALLDGIGSFGWSVLERRTGHSRVEIKEKIRSSFGGGGITRGSYSIAQAMAETGYSRTQLLRSRDALQQRWTRTAKKGHFLITAEQLEELAQWLCKDFWCKKHHLYSCPGCSRSDSPHFTGGLCKPCFLELRKWFRARSAKYEVSVRKLKFLPDVVNGPAADRIKSGRLPSVWEMEASTWT